MNEEVEEERNLRGLFTRCLGFLDEFLEFVKADVASAVLDAVQHIVKLSPLSLTAHPENFY